MWLSMTDDAVDTIMLAVEIDPSAFDEPRQLMYERLVEGTATRHSRN